MRSPDSLVTLLPSPGEVTAEVTTFTSRLSPLKAARYDDGGSETLICLEYCHSDDAVVKGTARVVVDGSPVPAKFKITGSGSFKSAVENGLPLEARMGWDGKLTLNPRTRERKKVIDFKMAATAVRIPPTD